ncbi:aspartate-semialdehyde dehydrogenase [Pseudoduganella albidiflava]|uniref:Aspartate-semialdehyde dehydrogenase n=3 Tax=Pseudoduganella albidiflava TaxID=321983 RepID=A0ABX5RMY2_9BURK|nr:aspartate-semialdehyde dehydrogenase [Pseudoduganella albidiflava]QBH99892.1 aspartate-semialdehyde dehydrogenase [Pseudoduganella albidiflava]
MKKVGLVGWRGMVGSVLLRRMAQEGDFGKISPHYFSTSAVGQIHIDAQGKSHTLRNAKSIAQLAEMDIVISCQGGDYTKAVYADLRGSGWDGYWIDAASAKRMDSDSVIVLDPVNRVQIDGALDAGIKNFIGGNCSITLSLLGLAGLFRAGLVEWMNVMTYQAASGAGAAHVRELLGQMSQVSSAVGAGLANPATPVLSLLESARRAMDEEAFPITRFGAPLAGSIIPWIDTDLGDGRSREEWKGEVETNKILNLPPGTIAVDGLCVRVGALQSHSAAIALQLKENVPLGELEALVSTAHAWVDFVPNTKADSMQRLSPAAVSGSLKVAVGRLRRLNVGSNLYSVLTTGDQLLWGAAEPLRRMLNILLER